jgi:hypothetical protein
MSSNKGSYGDDDEHWGILKSWFVMVLFKKSSLYLRKLDQFFGFYKEGC